MGTRASFWIGDPRDTKTSKWLGCIAYYGFPDNPDLLELVKARMKHEFMNAVQGLKRRKDFTCPEQGWPFDPHDIFAVDYTYAFFDGACRFSESNMEFKPALRAFELNRDIYDPSTRSVGFLVGCEAQG